MTLREGGCLGIPAGDLIIRGVWKCSGMKKSRSLGNGKILIPNLSSACRRISLEDGTVKADGDAGFVWLKPYRQGSASYSIIILPQATEAFRGEEGLLRLTSGGKSVAYKFDSSAERFNEGMQTTLNLTLKKEEGSEADLEFSNQTRWVYGIKSPAFPGKENVPSIPSWQKEVEDGIWFR